MNAPRTSNEIRVVKAHAPTPPPPRVLSFVTTTKPRCPCCDGVVSSDTYAPFCSSSCQPEDTWSDPFAGERGGE